MKAERRFRKWASLCLILMMPSRRPRSTSLPHTVLRYPSPLTASGRTFTALPLRSRPLTLTSRRQGVLTKDEYFDYKEKHESRIADLAVEMEQLEDGLRTMDTQIEQHRALEQDAAQIKTDRALTGALIERLIDRIEVSHDKQITVRYRFQSEFETYAEVLEQCRNM